VIGRTVYFVYANVLRPLWPGGAGSGRHCRFEPTCARYALDAVRTRGPVTGTGLAIWRVCRCNPWNDGGFDPVLPHDAVERRCEEITR
jgi:putative membrane protein insertion efficiency factor